MLIKIRNGIFNNNNLTTLNNKVVSTIPIYDLDKNDVIVQ